MSLLWNEQRCHYSQQISGYLPDDEYCLKKVKVTQAWSLSLFLLYFTLRLIIFASYDINYTWTFPDTRQYYSISQFSLTDLGFGLFAHLCIPYF